jgi:hypothetical protein
LGIDKSVGVKNSSYRCGSPVKFNTGVENVLWACKEEYACAARRFKN